MFITDLKGLINALFDEKEFRSIHICKKCLNGYKEKNRFEKHIKICINNKKIKFSFPANKQLESFHLYYNKFNSHPFDIYYDLETTSGNENDPYMYIMSYLYCVSFNSDMDNTKFKDFYVYQSIVQSITKFGDYSMIPDYIYFMKDKDDIDDIKEIN